MPCLSREFRIGVKLHEKPAYRLAQLAEVNPNDLYKLMSGIAKPKLNDIRILKVGRILGLSSDECFEAENT